MESEQGSEEQAHKKGRHRKKWLYNSILQQMEFYFSDSNLSKDRWLSEKTQTDPYVEVSAFLSFNRIRKLTTNIEDITKAISKSKVIELSEDKTKVRRISPVQVKENVDDCTIYVERLKSDATHEWLKSMFSEFGNVVYISMPKYKHNGMIKGFAFVEYDTEAEAKAALDYFESIDCKIPPNIEPKKLCSIATYEGGKDTKHDDDKKREEPNKESEESNKRNEESNKKKRKRSEDNEEVTVVKEVQDEINEAENLQTITKKKKTKLEDQTEKSDVRTETSENETEEKKKKKQKKSHRKKALKELGLLIISKQEWKKMRNRYLNTQRKTMQELKKHLNNHRFGSNEFNKRTHHEYRKNKRETTEDVDKQDRAEKPDEDPSSQFTSGIIVKISLPEPCAENKKLKNEIKGYSSNVKYVDIPLPSGSEEVYVRFADPESAQHFSSANFKGKACVLQGDEEKQYWQKIDACRVAKQNRGSTKQRGRDKLLKKAEKQIVKHIHFNDSD